MALHNWLDNSEKNKPPEYNEQLARDVEAWLGERSPEKVKLVRLLLARLTWDWKTLEQLRQKSMEEISRQEDDRGSEYQIYRMDICHFDFPVHLINVIRGIGKMRPVENFEGCGTYNSNIKKSIHAELIKINDWLLSRKEVGIAGHDQEELTRIWLFACLAKTIKWTGRSEAAPFNYYTWFVEESKERQHPNYLNLKTWYKHTVLNFLNIFVNAAAK